MLNCLLFFFEVCAIISFLSGSFFLIGYVGDYPIKQFPKFIWKRLTNDSKNTQVWHVLCYPLIILQEVGVLVLVSIINVLTKRL